MVKIKKKKVMGTQAKVRLYESEAGNGCTNTSACVGGGNNCENRHTC